MIPESAGATPYGIFLLAESFDEAASHVMASTSPIVQFSRGPAKLLYYHACELYLKAYLRLHQWDVDRLRTLNHDLARMLDEAVSAGLKIAPQSVADIRRATQKNDYVRTRYMVTENRQVEISLRVLARLTADIRESVRPACDPHGPSDRVSAE